jgi:hypothetical protein
MTFAERDSISHLDLLARTRALQAAAMRDDPETFRAELARLRTDLADHLQGERATLAPLPSITQRVVTRGQQRLLELVDQLVTATGEQNASYPSLIRSVALTRELSRQARLEAALFPDPGSSPRQ